MARSIPDAIALLLEKLIERSEPATGGRASREGGAVCPECGAPMEMISGCAYCFSCGYSPCKCRNRPYGDRIGEGFVLY